MVSITPTPLEESSSPSRRLTWLISGTSSGFGYRIALFAIRRGDNVLAIARSPLKLEKLIQQVTSLKNDDHDSTTTPTPKDRLKTFKLDLGDSEHVIRDVVDRAVKVWGRIDVLVNNAGTTFFSLFAANIDLTLRSEKRLGLAGFDRRNRVITFIPSLFLSFHLPIDNVHRASTIQLIMSENVMGTVKLTLAVTPYMRAQKSGTIITMGSRSAWRAELPVRLSLKKYIKRSNDYHRHHHHRASAHTQCLKLRFMVSVRGEETTPVPPLLLLH